jgi:hypothetical protein
MAKTAIVNPRGANGRFKKRKVRRHGAAKRRRNPAPSSASSDRNYNRRRRTKRRRNPAAPAASVYSSGGYRRKPNPSAELFDFDYIMDVMPAGTAGIWATRWAAKMAGPFEDDKPGFKHALAMLLGASVGANAVGSVFGDDKIEIARIAGIAFTGDLFARKSLFEDSEWIKENLMLAGIDAEDEEAEDWDQDFGGFESESALGAGEDDGQLFVAPDGTVYQLQGVAPDPAAMPGGVGAFESTSQLGAYPSAESSFGYAR